MKEAAVLAEQSAASDGAGVNSGKAPNAGCLPARDHEAPRCDCAPVASLAPTSVNFVTSRADPVVKASGYKVFLLTLGAERATVCQPRRQRAGAMRLRGLGTVDSLKVDIAELCYPLSAEMTLVIRPHMPLQLAQVGTLRGCVERSLDELPVPNLDLYTVTADLPQDSSFAILDRPLELPCGCLQDHFTEILHSPGSDAHCQMIGAIP
jgi:hypothetical protein